MAGRRRARADGAPRPPSERPRETERRPRGRRDRPVLDAKAARLAAGDLLSRRAWSQAELTRRLIRRGAPPEVAAAVVTDLAGRGYLDDAAYARHFVETRAARGYGAARLSAELHARGVPPALITAALAALDGETQLARARALAERRLPALRRAAPDRAAGRLRDHLLRRGFSGSVAVRVVRELIGRTPLNSAVLE
jgi:regulatory protein